MEFANPLAFLLLLFIPLVFWLSRRRLSPALRYSSKSIFVFSSPGWRVKFRPVLVLLRILCLILIVAAIARPREGIKSSNIFTEGVAMQMVVDRSGSMNEQFEHDGQQLSRFEMVKVVAKDFIKGDGKSLSGRSGDMIGLVAFARYPDTICPLIHNHTVLLDFIDQMDTVKIRAEDGTAIGEAIALASARLKTAEEQIKENNRRILGENSQNQKGGNFEIAGKVMILLTDGINNQGDTDPIEAAKLAAEWGIKIYTIGIGAAGGNFFGMMPFSNNIDEKTLQRIADMTGGFYAKAGNPDDLRSIYEKIDALEKTKIETVDYYEYKELFAPLIIIAISLLILEILLNCTVFSKIP